MASAETDDKTWSKWFGGPKTNAEVWIHSKCRKELTDLDAKDRAKIEACMELMYCTFESPQDIPPKKFNRNEGRHGNRLLQAFTEYQGRVYGAEGSINGKRTFFASYAAVKKKNKADPAVLKRAAERLGGVTDHVSGAVV
jgi:hypothetical protein